jgi:hypothetical protein
MGRYRRAQRVGRVGRKSWIQDLWRLYTKEMRTWWEGCSGREELRLI